MAAAAAVRTYLDACGETVLWAEWVSKRKGTKREKRVLAISAQRAVTFRTAAFGKITVRGGGAEPPDATRARSCRLPTGT